MHIYGGHLMGESEKNAFQFEFNRSIKVEFREDRMSADAGALLLRTLDEKVGYTSLLVEYLTDPRDQSRIIYKQKALVREKLYLVAQGWSRQDDADHMARDPSYLLSVSDRKGQTPLRPSASGDQARLASQPTHSRLNEALSSEHNRSVMREMMPIAVGARLKAQKHGPFITVVLDIDTFPVYVYGSQAGSAYNGYYKSTVYNVFMARLAETGDILDVTLKPGNAHTSDGADDYLSVLLDLVESEICQNVKVRHDAGIQNESVAATVESNHNRFVCRIKKNKVLEQLAKPYVNNCKDLKPGEERTFELPCYKAGSWSRERRVVLVVKYGGLFPDYFFLVTNFTPDEMPGPELLDFYRKRGAFEGMIGEFKSELQLALSCTTRPKSTYNGNTPSKQARARSDDEVFACNEATLLLFAWSYNLANLFRRCVEKALPVDRGQAEEHRMGGWSLKRTRQMFQKVVARFVLHARNVTMILGESARKTWKAVWSEIERLPKVPAISSEFL